MPAAINLKPELIDSAVKRSQFSIAVFGCGQTGIFFAFSLATSGFKVSCLDADASKVKKVAKGKLSIFQQEIQNQLKNLITSGQLTITSEIRKALLKSDIIFVTVPGKVDEKNKTDYSEVITTLKQVGSTLHPGVLVIISDIVGFGFMEGIAKETLENTSGLKAGVDFGLVYMPVFSSHIVISNLLPSFGLTIGAVGEAGLEAAANIAKTITANVKQSCDTKTVELATLFRIAQRDVNTALANELAVFCEKTDCDYFQVLPLLSGMVHPSAIDEKSGNDPYLLCDTADNANVKMRLTALSRQINEEMVKHAVTLTQDALYDCDKSVRRARVAILGNINSLNSTASYVKLLALKGSKVSVYDPISKGDGLDLSVVKGNLNEAVEGADCIVILTADQPFCNLNLKKIKPLTKSPALMLDLAGAYEPEKVKAEGFIYRGLGRGI